MARPSKLTEKQWAEVERRVLGGEAIRALAREFGVIEGSIRRRVNTHTKPVRNLAAQLAAAEMAVEKLPIVAQVKVRSLADNLKGISQHLASAAEFGSMTAHRLSAIAHAQSDKIDEAASLYENGGAIRSVVVMTQAANEAAKIGLNLLAANKGLDRPAETSVPSGLGHFYGEFGADA